MRPCGSRATAVDLSRETDLLGIQGDALMDLADVRAVLGQPKEAASALARGRRALRAEGQRRLGGERTRGRGELAGAV